MHTRLFVTICCTMLLSLLPTGTLTRSVTAHDTNHDVVLTATLAGKEEVPGPGDPQGRGQATITLNAAAGRICYAVSVADLTAPPLAAHIHLAPRGYAGPVVARLHPPPGQTSTSHGCVTIADVPRATSPADLQGLAAAISAHPYAFYVNVHTRDFPLGAVRGQLAESEQPLITLTFDELPFQPVHGLRFQGVTFGFTVDDVASTDAHYHAFGPGQSTYVQDPSLEGAAAGTLTLTFDLPTSVLAFGVARSTEAPLTPGVTVELFDPAGVSLGTFAVELSPLRLFAEGQFSYAGAAVHRAVITFPSPEVAPRFALDNLTFAGSGVASAPEGGRGPAGQATPGWPR